jgi:hypothetical protein
VHGRRNIQPTYRRPWSPGGPMSPGGPRSPAGPGEPAKQSEWMISTYQLYSYEDLLGQRALKLRGHLGLPVSLAHPGRQLDQEDQEGQ